MRMMIPSTVVAALLFAASAIDAAAATFPSTSSRTAQRSVRREAADSRTVGASISTTFGVYKPYIVPEHRSVVGTGEPEVAANFSNVAADTRFAWNSYFSPAERALLVANGFVARPEAIANFSSAYAAELSPSEMGSFITVDAVLHGLRVTLAEASRDMERNYASPTLAGGLADLSAAIGAQLDRTHTPAVTAALTHALAYVQTAQGLLSRDVSIDRRVAADVAAEIKKVTAADGSLPSSVFPRRTINYAQFAPRGFYALDAQLSSYYRAKAWLSQVGFPLRSGGSLDLAGLRDAAVLARMVGGMGRGDDLRQLLRNINEPAAFLAGGSPEGSFDALNDLLEAYYGRAAAGGPDFLADERMLTGFATYIADRLPESVPGHPVTMFRLIEWGPAPETLIDRIAAQVHAGRGGVGYAVASAAGSPRATELLGARSGFEAGSSESELGGSLATWVGDVEHAVIYTVQPLMTRTAREGDPRFMRGDAWRDRSLQSALGAIADIEHEPATMTMQGVAKAGRVTSHRDVGSAGYVEPNPEAWARVASLASYLRNGFTEGRGDRLIRTRIADKFRDIEVVSANLMQISAAELGDVDLKKEQLEMIAAMRDRIVAYESFVDKGLQGDGYVVTEGTRSVHGDSRIANGHPLAIYVIVPRNDGEDGLMLTRGAIYSYFETDQDDDDWRSTVTSPSRSTAPDSRLAGSFVSSERPFSFSTSAFTGISASLPPGSVAYTPTRTERIAAANKAEVRLEATVVRRYDDLWFTVSAPSLEGATLLADIVDRSGSILKQIEIGHVQNGERLDVIRIGELESGAYSLEIEDTGGNLLATAPFRVTR